MLYSHNLQDIEMSFFASFLDKAINGDTKYKDLVFPIILDAVDLAQGKKKLYELDSHGLAVKILLFQEKLDLLKQISPDNIQDSLLEIKTVIEKSNNVEAIA